MMSKQNFVKMLELWDEDFNEIITSHTQKVSSVIVHPHPIVSAVRNCIVVPNNIETTGPEQYKIYNPW